MSAPILDALRSLYLAHQVPFRELEHEPTRTSEESARVRGEPLKVGGKALVLKTGDEFRLVVLPADRALHSATARRSMGIKKSSFATPEELMALTGLVPGSVPPFGEPILPLKLYVDRALTENDRIAFNAGSLVVSHILAMDDYLLLAQPQIVALTAPPST